MTTAAAPAMRTTTTPTGHVTVVAPADDLTIEDCAALRAALRAAAEGPELLVVDLLDVPSIDAAVVEVLVGAAARCTAAGLRLVVANAGAQPWLALVRAHVPGVVRAHRRTAPPLSELAGLLAPWSASRAG
jgi:anti-anti-sigma factor